MGILLRDVIYCVQDDLRIAGRFIRIIYPGEAFYLTTPRFF